MNRKYSLGGRQIDQTTNFLVQNASSVRDYKNTKLQQNRNNIDFIHASLMGKKNVTSETANLHAIQKTLNPTLRQFFMLNPDHAELLSDMNNLNGNFIDVIDTVCGYRIELGLSLQKLVECYNSIFVQ
jgi:hypothetical protein